MKNMGLPLKKTKIVCTIGPASGTSEVLSSMIAMGMNIARINFAHGDFETHRRSVANIRAAAEEVGKRVAILGDLPGPKMRIGKLAQEPIELARGQQIVLQSEEITGHAGRVSVNFAGLAQAVKPGDDIFMNDGYIQLKVDEVDGGEVHCTIVVGGELRSYKGVNFPGIDLGISAFTESDREFLALAAELELDAVSQSFVQGPEDIVNVRDTAASLDFQPLIIAKIERAGAVDNYGAILEVADGVMVARGDLGVEIPIERIPAVQKKLIHLANLNCKPVITATQMLESMTTQRRPTRAEVTDVANAILDGTDALMLSGETAVGRYPAEAVAVMARVAQETEKTLKGAIGDKELLEIQNAKTQIQRDDLISAHIYSLAGSINPTLIFVPSLSGATARRVARFRPPQWIIAPCRDETTCQKLQFSFGIFPVFVPAQEVLASPEERQTFTRQWLEQYGVEGDVVLLIEGSGTLKAKDTRRIDIIDIR